MARKGFTEHPEFMRAGQAANDALVVAAKKLGLDPRDLDAFDVQAGRAVDDFTRLLLRAYDAKQARPSPTITQPGE